MERSLLAQRSLLQLEVGDLAEQYAAMKRDAVHREAAMNRQLRALAQQLQVVRQDASAVDDEIIASLFEQIGESLRGLIDIGQSP
jgi:FtsZ-binding cell division protein ZapB